MLKLSIVVPVYNMEAYLNKCLDSVIYADRSDYEIIVVNDGSTDSSSQIIQEYAARYPDLIRSIETENGGLGAARNVGIKAAQGEYVAFLDSDDYLSENAVPEMIEAISRDCDICIFNILSVTSDRRVLDKIIGFGGTRTHISLSVCPSLLLEPLNACNKIYRRTLFTDNNIYFPGRVWFEDVPTVPKFYLLTDKIIYCNKDWYYYLNRPGSITNNKSKAARNLEIIQGLDELADFYRKAGKYDEYEKEFEFLYFHNQFLTSSVRAIMADPESDAVKTLTGDFLSRFPDYKKNLYVKYISNSHKLLSFLLSHGMYKSVRLVMELNNIKKGKDK